MNHKQILDTLAAANLVKALEFDIAFATSQNMRGPKWDKPDPAKVAKVVTAGIRRRWRCALDAPATEVSPNYKAKVWLAMAVLFHKYGFSDAQVSSEARKAIDFLNDTVALSDHFFRKTEEIKNLLSIPPTPLSKRPSHAEHLTFWRAGDVVAYVLDDWAYALYVHEVPLGNEVPLLSSTTSAVALSLNWMRCAAPRHWASCSTTTGDISTYLACTACAINRISPTSSSCLVTYRTWRRIKAS